MGIGSFVAAISEQGVGKPLQRGGGMAPGGRVALRLALAFAVIGSIGQGFDVDTELRLLQEEEPSGAVQPLTTPSLGEGKASKNVAAGKKTKKKMKKAKAQIIAAKMKKVSKMKLAGAAMLKKAKVAKAAAAGFAKKKLQMNGKLKSEK